MSDCVGLATRLALAVVFLCGASAAAGTPLTTCKQGWTLDGLRVEPLGLVLRVKQRGADYEVDVSDGRVWTFSEREGNVVVESGPIEALNCTGRLEKTVLDGLVQRTLKLAPAREVGVCERRGAKLSVSVSPVLEVGAVEVIIRPDEESVWRGVVRSVAPRVVSRFVRCYAAAGLHCDETPPVRISWAPTVLELPAFDSEPRSKWECAFDKEQLIKR